MATFSRPIPDLPTEILIIIFHEATDMEVRRLDLAFWLPTDHLAPSHSFGWALGPRPGTSPWNLAQVCALWREIALATPELWTNVFLHVRANCTPPIAPPPATGPGLPRMRDIVRRIQPHALGDILMRSDPKPLRLRLKTTFAATVASQVNTALGIILSHEHRIELLDIRLPDTIPLPSMYLPNMRHLSLREQYTVPVDVDPAHLLLSVRPMSTQTMNRMDYFGHTLNKYTIRTSSMPWAQITVLNLRLDWIAWQNILHVLAFTAHVEMLSISSNGISQIGVYDHETPTSVIVLSSLTSMSFCLFQFDIISVLAALQTPNLRLLDLRVLPYGHPSMIQPPEEVMLRALDNVACAQALVTLRLVDVELARPLIHSLLCSLDLLEHIAIRCPSESFPDLTGIIQYWTTTPLSPQLQSLSLMSSTWDYAPQGTLLQLVHSRCQLEGATRLGVRPLRHLHITRRLCPAHSRLYERDEIDIRSLSLPFTSVVWRDMDFDGKSPALRYCSYCHAGVGEPVSPTLFHSW